MTSRVGTDRLPTFTEEQKKMVMGSYDFIGLNHYSTKFTKFVDTKPGDWANDK